MRCRVDKVDTTLFFYVHFKGHSYNYIVCIGSPIGISIIYWTKGILYLTDLYGGIHLEVLDRKFVIVSLDGHFKFVTLLNEIKYLYTDK